MPNKQGHNPHELRNKEDERENDEPEQSMTKNFADNVAVQDAHDAER